ncbi:unnamed protein product [Nippostrongylus brasiliensis]|uniref:ABC transporter domain-containing protein n=1 Tax=Nippostrongylus brasiliensis TaxID=27835 RepID=A0A3P7CIA3_NIPBR|nr:unnamed protein product [Nippostrongylus brasiliensis]
MTFLKESVFSGTGKTTLLNILLDRNLAGLDVEGEVLVNGQSIGRGVTSVSAYVQQEDLFVGTLTVREHLMIQAKLKLPSSFNHAMRVARVDEVMTDMLLEKSQSSRIGVPGVVKGISGGEMKRLAFASEMLSNPQIFFCDEPTSGLDSYMAELVVTKLESLAGDRGKTIICTIKQPSSEVFNLFDKVSSFVAVVFLVQGRVAFHGAPNEAVAFFAKCGYMVPDHTNPADHFSDVIDLFEQRFEKVLAIWPEKIEECKKKTNAICDEFANSKYLEDLEAKMKAAEQKRSLRPHHGPGFYRLVSALFERYAKDNIRNKSMLRAKFVQKTFMALFLGFLYFQTQPDQDGVTNLKGILFFFCSELTYPTVYGIQTYMPTEFALLVREYHNGNYPVLAYYLAKITSYMPIFSTDGIILTGVAYWLIGLAPDPARYFRVVFTGVLVELMVASLGVAVCSMSPSYAVAVTITGPLLTIYSMTGGLFTNVAMLPDWIRWVQYLSWFRFGYESFIITEWTYEKYDNITCTMSSGKVAESCEHSGAEVIRASLFSVFFALWKAKARQGESNLNFNESNMYFNWLCMLAYTIAHYCVGYIALTRRVLSHR